MSSRARAVLGGLICLAGAMVTQPASAGQVRFGAEGHAYTPVFSLDGKYVAFEVNKLAGQVDQYVSELQGAIAKDAVRISLPGSSSFAGGDVVAVNPTWHPQGIVVFEGSNPGGQLRLYYYQPGTGAASEMIPSSEIGGKLTFPAISRDGKTMAFVASETGNGDIRTRDSSTNKLTQVTSTSATESFPLFSQDGTEIVFTRKHADTEDIFLMRLSDGMEKEVQGGPGDQSRPAFAKGGDRVLYFDSTKGENHWDLFSIASGGGDLKVIGKGVRLPLRGRPAVSPDGEWVAYSYDDPQKANSIFISKVDGSQTVEIKTEHTACGEPALGKQGDRIMLGYTALPNAGAEWRFLTVVDVTDQLR